MPIISNIASPTSSLVPITHPNFNNGKTTDLYFNFSLEEVHMQFEEVFIEQYYQAGLVKKNMVVVDIGAAMGLTALYFKDHAKKVYALEPNQEVYESAVKNTEQYKEIQCFPFGIGGNTRETLLYGYNNAPASTGELRPNITSEKMVRFVALDEFFSSQNIDHVDLLKIDCEGAEYEIFCSDGFAKVAPKIDYIIGEAHWQPPRIPYYIPQMLKEYGFETSWLPFDNLYLGLIMQLPGQQQKKYQTYIKSMFFAKRVT